MSQSDPQREPRRPTSGRIALKALLVVFQLGIAAGFIAGGLLIAQSLIATRPTLASQEQTEPSYAVQAQRITLSDIRPDFAVFGAVEARRSVEMRALVAGEVVAVNEDLVVGGQVAGGARLIQIDPFSYEGAVIEASANLEEAEAQLRENEARLENEVTALARTEEQLEIARRERDRAEDLARRGSGTRAAEDAARRAYSQQLQAQEAAANAIVTRRAQIERLRASLRRLQWRLSQAERDLRDTALDAPFDGVVRSENVEVGRRLGVNDVVAELYAAGALDVRFTVSDRQFGRLRDAAGPDGDGGAIGRTVGVAWAVGDAPVRTMAAIDRIGADVSANRGGVELIARIDAADAARLKPGAVVEVTVPDRIYQNAFVAPEAAIFNGEALFVIEADAEGDTRLRRRAVEALAYQGDDVIVRPAEGVELGGALMMTTRLAEAGDGVLVRILGGAEAGDAPEALAERDPDAPSPVN